MYSCHFFQGMLRVFKGFPSHTPCITTAHRRGKADVGPENTFSPVTISLTKGEGACRLDGVQREQSRSSTRGFASLAHSVRPGCIGPGLPDWQGGKQRGEQAQLQGSRAAIMVGVWHSRRHSPEEEGQRAGRNWPGHLL